MKQKKSSALIFAGVISAVAASLCCIIPVLVLLAGSSGIASSFSFLEPARPYLISITALILGIAWYLKLKPKTQEEIECECDEKPSFWQSRLFLGIVTVFSALMLSFPYYSHIFFPKTETKIIITEPQNITVTTFQIEGMTCQGCEEHIKNAVSELPGVISAEANHESGTATIKFDKSKTSLDEVVASINQTGYKVISQEEIKQ